MKMITRRTFFISAAASSFALPAWPQEEVNWQDVLRDAIANEANNPIFLGRTPLPADDPRWDEARALLEDAPTVGTSFEVATYLDASVPASFRKEWPKGYANPLIVLMFQATNTTPAGDTTPWCAAFVSWCLERVHHLSAHSAASKAYRNFGEAVWVKGDPLPGPALPGDLAVFRQRSDPDHGHVTFFLGMDPKSKTRIRAVGGNQSDAIGESRYRVDADLELHSLRRVI